MYSIDDIPVGRENAISRKQLAELWGCNDRAVRDHVARLRCKEITDGMFIVSHSQSGVKGYYRTNKPDEIRHYVHEGRKRIRNTKKTIDNAQKLLKALEEAAG